MEIESEPGDMSSSTDETEMDVVIIVFIIG